MFNFCSTRFSLTFFSLCSSQPFPFLQLPVVYRDGLISPSEDACSSLIMSSPGSAWSSFLLLMLGDALSWSCLGLLCPHCLLCVVHVLSFQLSPLWTLCSPVTSLLITCLAVLPHCACVALALSMPACEQLFQSVHWPQSIEHTHILGSSGQWRCQLLLPDYNIRFLN